jgi:hypothetical protein
MDCRFEASQYEFANNVLLWGRSDLMSDGNRDDDSSAAKFTSKARTDLHMRLGSPSLSIRDFQHELLAWLLYFATTVANHSDFPSISSSTSRIALSVAYKHTLAKNQQSTPQRSSAHNTHNHGLTTTLSTLTTGTLIPRSPAPTHWSISHPPKRRTSPQTAPQTLHSKCDFFLAPSTTNLIPTARGLRLKPQCDVLARR